MMRTVRDATPTTATFLFTDIEASTQLLKSHRNEYASILADHHRLLREQFAAHGGREIDNQGDAFFVAFARAKDAVLAAAASQRALVEHSWPGGASVSVRMGIHTGEADLTVDRYVGLAVHRTARISAMGHGGQVLVSQTTASLLDDEDQLPDIVLRDLGEHRLKDISRPVRLYQLDISGLHTRFPRLKLSEPPRPNRRKRAALGGVGLLVAGLTTVALALTLRDEPPPAVLPNSLVRVDPTTLEPTQVVPIGNSPDLVVSAGGFVWMTHHVLRDIDSAALRDAGDRTLTRVDPTTSEVVVVGGGLAPCGLAADPSGDVWVANCFAVGADRDTNVVRIDATTLGFEATWPVPGGDGFYRGLAYGGGSLWVSEVFGDNPPQSHSVTEVDPLTGALRSIALADGAAALAWSEGYGDLWLSNFFVGSVSRMHAATESLDIVDAVVLSPGQIAIDGENVWVADWAVGQVARLNAISPTVPRTVNLPTSNRASGVWNVATGHGYVWATTPRDGALWRIDPMTDDVVRVTLPPLPTGVATDAGGVWVTVRGD
jgi:class 3 adenylate cyclase/streptogramin lyase